MKLPPKLRSTISWLVVLGFLIILSPEPAHPDHQPVAPRLALTRTRPADRALMVHVPAGSFHMRTSDSDLDTLLAACPACRRPRFLPEQPQQQAFLDAFWIARTEVTNA